MPTLLASSGRGGPFAPLETPRLRLRCVEMRDASAVSGALTPFISRCLLSWPFPFTPEMALDRIRRARESAAEGAMVPFIIEGRAEGIFLGWLSVTRESNADHGAVLSYWLGEAHHGRGYMKEAVTAAIIAAFDMLDVDIIRAEAQIGNAASRKVLEGCGMIFIGEKMVFAPARGRDEPSAVYTRHRAADQPGNQSRNVP